MVHAALRFFIAALVLDALGPFLLKGKAEKEEHDPCLKLHTRNLLETDFLLLSELDFGPSRFPSPPGKFLPWILSGLTSRANMEKELRTPSCSVSCGHPLAHSWWQGRCGSSWEAGSVWKLVCC